MKSDSNSKRILKRFWEVLDKLVFSLLLSAVASLLLPIRRTVPIYILLSLFIFGLTWIVSKSLGSLRTRTEEREQKRERMLVSLLLKEDGEIGEMIGEPCLVLIRKAQADLYAVTDAVRSGAKTIAVPCNSRQLKTFTKQYAPRVRVIGFDELLTRFDPELQEKKESFFKRTVRDLFGAAWCKYALLGAACFLLSFSVRLKIYYRFLSTACMIAATITGFLRKRTERKNL